eukprot:1339039-Pleurochrysis_carterae.AAC.1
MCSIATSQPTHLKSVDKLRISLSKDFGELKHPANAAFPRRGFERVLVAAAPLHSAELAEGACGSTCRTNCVGTGVVRVQLCPHRIEARQRSEQADRTLTTGGSWKKSCETDTASHFAMRRLRAQSSTQVCATERTPHRTNCRPPKGSLLLRTRRATYEQPQRSLSERRAFDTPVHLEYGNCLNNVYCGSQHRTYANNAVNVQLGREKGAEIQGQNSFKVNGCNHSAGLDVFASSRRSKRSASSIETSSITSTRALRHAAPRLRPAISATSAAVFPSVLPMPAYAARPTRQRAVRDRRGIEMRRPVLKGQRQAELRLEISLRRN